MFSARFDEKDEDDPALDEIELYFYFNSNRNLTEADIDKTDVRSSHLEQQMRNQETIDSDWRFGKIESMTK